MKEELKPSDGRKSFYGKAMLTRDPKGYLVLESYGKPIAKEVSGKAELIFPYSWESLSATSRRHFRSFKDHVRTCFLASEREGPQTDRLS